MMIISRPRKIKDATVATGLITITYSSDLDKKPAARKSQSKIIKRLKIQSKDLTLSPESVIQWMDPPTWTQSSQDSVSLDKEDIGLLAGGSYTQSIIQGGENIICSDVITHVLTNSGELTLECDYFPFKPLKA